MEPWSEIRRRVLTGGLSKRQACEQNRIHWKTLAKILTHEESLGNDGGSRPGVVRRCDIPWGQSAPDAALRPI
jgi:hypothetical protein